MDAISYYSFASCIWNGIQALPLLLGPQAISSLLAVHHHTQATVHVAGEVETYLARSLGIALVTLGLVTIVLTGSVPFGSVAEYQSEAPSPYAAPVLLLTTFYHGANAFLCWARYNQSDKTGYFLGFTGSAILAAYGLWCMLFGGEKGRISRRTGADKRTSGFPFRNAEADKRKVR